MKLWIKILAFISQTVVIVLILMFEKVYFDWSDIVFVIIGVNGLSLTFFCIPEKFNDAYHKGYKKVVTIDLENDDQMVESLGFKGVFYRWIFCTIGSFLAAVASQQAFGLIFIGYSCLFLIVDLVYITRQILKKDKE